MKFLEPAWLVALWVAPALAALYVAARGLRARAVRRFLGTKLAGLSVRVDWKRRLVKAGLVVGAAALLALALARPGFNPEPRKVKRTGRDVAFLIDVSRSMLAEDIKPNRLERAKLAVRDALDAVKGDRVGIIAFAGSSSVRCPLTTDYSFARQALDAITPESVPIGGTLIGDAIRTALDQLFKTDKGDDGSDRFRDIILITDGEDHDSFPVEAAAQAGKRGVRIIAIGIGSELGGAPIPAGEKADEEFVKYKGEVVKSREDPESLRKIAAASRDGVFLNVGTGNIQLDKVYQTLMDRAERREMESAERTRYHEGFQVFLGAALLMLVLEGFIGETARRRRDDTDEAEWAMEPSAERGGPGAERAPSEQSAGRPVHSLACVVLAMMMLTGVARGAGDPVHDAVERGNALYKEGKFAEAAAAYGEVKGEGAGPEVLYNLGCAQGAAGDLVSAEASFKKAAAGADARVAAMARYNLGSVQFRGAQALAEKQPEQALEMMRKSERSFRGALDLDPRDRAAAKNVEAVQLAAKQLMEKMLQQQQQEQQKQKQDQQKKQQQQKNGDQKQGQGDQQQKDQQGGDQQKQQEQQQGQQDQSKQDSKDGQGRQDQKDSREQLSEKLSDLADKQQDLAEKSKELSKQQEASKQGRPGAPSPEKNEKERADLAKQQEQLSKESEAARQQLEQMKKQATDPEKAQGAPESMSKARESQKEAEKALEKGDAGGAEKAQEQAAERMREASQQAAPAPEQEDQQQKQKSEGAQNEPGAPKPGAAKQDSQKKPGATGALEAAEASDQKAGPRQPVDVVAAQILDKERREQDALKRYLRTLRGRAGKPKAGDKDW